MNELFDLLKEHICILSYKTHHLDLECNHGYDGSRHCNNYILIYISIRNMDARILMSSSFRNIRVDRLTYKVKQNNLCIYSYNNNLRLNYLYEHYFFLVETSSTYACIFLLHNPTCDSHNIYTKFY